MSSGTSTAPGRYCELHAHSCFSLLDGVPFPEELAQRAAELGQPALALTDHDAVYGLVPFVRQAKECGVKPILGVELTLDDGSHMTLLAETQAGYSSLCQLITLGRLNAPKGQCAVPWAALSEHGAGLICLTGCRKGRVAKHLLVRDSDGAGQALDELVAIFGHSNIYVELQRNWRRDDGRLSRALAALAKERHLPCVATGNVHYLARADGEVQDVLVGIRERLPLPQAKHRLRPNHEYFLRSPAAMAALFADLPEAVANTLSIAERCHAKLPNSLQVLPVFPTPNNVSALAYVRQLCEKQLPVLYPKQQPAARALLEKELALIEALGLANYFLIVWDIVRFCQKNDILCHGRGSAANSLVARLLGISAVDPIGQALVVERFLSVERGGTPDIDLDIDAARRERVIQYVYNRWGRDHAAMACTYVTYRSASAIRDAGYVLGFKPELVNTIADAIEAQRHAQEPDADGRIERPDTPVGELASHLGAMKGTLANAEWNRLLAIAEQLRHRPRHLGLHNGGMVITGLPIADIVPVEPATMAERTVVQFDKEHLEALGLVKIDLLGLRMLSAIADTVQLVREQRGHVIQLHRLDLRERQVYDHICSAQTIGIFQVESGAQVSIIPQLQPKCFQDLVIEVSLIRPGPLQGHMVRPYIRRRHGLEPVAYLHPLLQPALAETLGVLVFQEQVIKVARDVAGFSPGRGELLRQALGGKEAAEALARFKDEFLSGAMARGVSVVIAEKIWGMIAGFAGYSFSKAHAAAFAVIVYWSAWLRVHFPPEYFCGLLRHSPLGTYPAHVLESEARRVGVKFLPFDINHSAARPSVERNAIRFGLGYVKGIGDETAEAIVQARGDKPFRSLADFIRRTKLGRRAVEALILSGAFDRFGERRQVLWELVEAFDLAQRPPELPLDIPDERARLRPMLPEQKALATFAATGVTAGLHLAEFKRDAFTRAGCLPYAELRKMRAGMKVMVGGLTADGLRRPPTANGASFLRLEMPEGLVDVIVPPAVYAAHREALRAAFIMVEGTLQKNGPVLSVVAQTVHAL